ncbi:probable protein phosphatase 2C 37 [Phragmites australis]|uniref:probable protein phosphatase 2C 37 n=1 Tax=Phragmites australis TaxID=29695 RepID=UPI002D79844B|nr:probable protein phosphatase 2C 37 [Phragmites australis]
MATSAGVNMPGGPGASSSTPKCGDKRSRPASPSSSSSSDQGLPDKEGEEEQVGLGPLATAGLAPPALPAAAQVWPVAFGWMDLQGRPRGMEDTVSLHPGFCAWADGSPMHFFAVFDGHGGSSVSVLCRERMHVILAEELAAGAAAYLHWRGEQMNGAGVVVGAEQQEELAWRAALSRCFRRVDAMAALACACGRISFPRCRCPLALDPRCGIVGSTAVVAVLVRDRLIVANCGDSRAVLCRGPPGAPAVPLSSDHKPERPDEMARIQAVGGWVLCNNGPRVRGILAMTRALGDWLLRPEVISEPEITITRRRVEDDCLILASDGMWDVVENETACNIARHCLDDVNPAPVAGAGAAAAVGPDPDPRCNIAACLLVRLAMCRGSQDNVSVVVVDLKPRG